MYVKKRRMSIRLSPDEDKTLRVLHRHSGIPDGQFPQRPKFWRRFTDVWNEATDRSDSPEELLHYIMTRRKRPRGRPGRWEPFGDDYKPLKCPQPDVLSEEHWAIVDQLYVELGISADSLLVDAAARQDFLTRFVARTGEHVPDLLFVAAIVARRKGGLLPKTGRAGSEGGEDIGFGDIDMVG